MREMRKGRGATGGTVGSKVAALAGRLTAAVADAASEAIRAAAIGLGAAPAPALQPVRVRSRGADRLR